MYFICMFPFLSTCGYVYIRARTRILTPYRSFENEARSSCRSSVTALFAGSADWFVTSGKKITLWVQGLRLKVHGLGFGCCEFTEDLEKYVPLLSVTVWAQK